MRTKKGLQSKDAIFTSELTRRLLPQKMVINPRCIEQSGFLRRVLLVKNFPASIDNDLSGSLESDFALTGVTQIKNTTFSMRLTPMNPLKTAALIDRQINNTLAQSHERKGSRQIEAAIDQDSIAKSYNDLLREKGRFYYVNIYIEVYAEDEKELRERVKAVVTELAAHHISVEELIYQQPEGYTGVNPVSRDPLTLTANNIPSNTLSRMFAFSHSSRNDPEGMLLGKTRDGGYMFLDLWHRDQSVTSGNFIVLGETGYGKSWLMKKVVSQQAVCGNAVYSFDPESEYNDLFRNLGGTVCNCASGRFLINPYEIRRLKTGEDGEEDLDEEIEALRQDQSFFQHLSWLRDFYKVLFPAADGKELSALSLLTKDMYLRHGIDHKTDLSKLGREDYPTFTDLYEYMREVLEEPKKRALYKMLTDDLIRDLLLLTREAYDGSLSPLFNGHTNFINDEHINFNIHLVG